MDLMETKLWLDAWEAHPWEICEGDTIGTPAPAFIPYQVKEIDTPRGFGSHRKWTFWGEDEEGRGYACSFARDHMVVRFAEAKQ